MTKSESEALYLSVGGKMTAHGQGTAVMSNPYWDFGWVPKDNREEEVEKKCDKIEKSMPRFAIEGKDKADSEKVCLFDLWRHEEVVAALGYQYSGTHQLTGSCVGAAFGNVAFTLAAVEVLRLGDAEKIILPFYPYTYGRGRYRSGMSGRGEGSSGTGQAEAAVKDGVLDNKSHPELPMPNNSDGLVWGASVEMEWSAGNLTPCKTWLEKGVKHLIKTASKLSNSGEVKQAIANLYPVTCASMYGHNPKVVDGVLMGIRGPRWSHQMSILAYWDHPKLGLIFWLMNQWGLNAHGKDPAGGPPGGVWITAKDMDYICQDEVFAFSQFEGYPAPDWDVDWIY